MCGEHQEADPKARKQAGSSPHVRGTRVPSVDVQIIPGIIPACAGNTSGRAWRRMNARDHPRMCGEHASTCKEMLGRVGSSPHVRGTHEAVVVSHVSSGIIPACAGNTFNISIRLLPLGDHPRMCGEHHEEPLDGLQTAGSSPHVRGTPFPLNGERQNRGIIPACAGNTHNCPCSSQHTGDHPRMCGEHETSLTVLNISTGSSPHVRGTRRGHGFAVVPQGIIPACAGNTHRARAGRRQPRDHPRMCGEHMIWKAIEETGTGSSPHVRGTH